MLHPDDLLKPHGREPSKYIRLIGGSQSENLNFCICLQESNDYPSS